MRVWRFGHRALTFLCVSCAGPTHAVAGPYPAGLLAQPSGKGESVDVVQQRAFQAFQQ